MDPVTHFQMPATDRKRVAEFYAKAFGWQSNQLGPEMGNYLLVTTASADKSGMSTVPGTINGGFFDKTQPDQYPNLVIQVEDIKAAMEKVKAAGGIVLGGMRSPTEPDDMPGVGLFVSIRDSEGNRVGLMQPVAGMKR